MVPEITPQEQEQLDELYADFEAAHMTPLWTQIGGLMPHQPAPGLRCPMLWRWSTLLPLAEQAGELVPVGRGGERRAIALANPGLPGHAVRHPDAVGGDPVPRPARGGTRAPAHADRVPVRRRGRGRVDQRRGRPGRDAARGPAAHPRHALPRAPQHHRPPDGLDRRAGHPAGPPRSTPASSSSARTCSPRRRPRRSSRNERLWGHPGLTPVGAPAPTRARRSWPTAGSTPTPR